MSTTEQEALAPQSDEVLDAPVTAPPSEPDGKPEGAADEADPSPAAKTDTSDSPEPAVKGVQKRIDELTKNWRETERRERESARDAAYWREQALRLQTQQPQQPVRPEPEAQKTLADFGFNDAAFDQWKLERVAEAAEARAEKRYQEKQAEAEKLKANAEYARKARDFKKDHPDYHEVVDYAPISESVAEIIKIITPGPDVAYYLGKNPEIAQQISALPGQYAAFEIGQIAARLEFEKSRIKSARTLVSSAPQPTPKIEGSEPAITPKASSPDSDSMTMDQWLKQRNKEVKPRKR
jgi:hypothetical protein